MATLAGAGSGAVDAATDVVAAPAAGTLGFAQVVSGITAVVAPASLVTGIAFYFGWVHTDAFTRYFGLDPSVVSLSTRDYVVASLHPLFLPTTCVLVVLIALGLVHSLTRSLDLHLRAQEVRLVSDVALVVGGVLFVVGALAAFGTISVHYLFATLGPDAGVILLAYAVSLRRRLAGRRLLPSTIVLVALLTVLSLFWAVGVYAGNVGRSDARSLASSLDQLPQAILYSKVHIGILGGHGVVRSVVPGSEYPVRYTGLRLLVRSDGKYFLLPNGWTHDNGAEAVVLPESDSWRLAFVPGTYITSGSALNAAGGGELRGVSATLPAPQYLGPLTVSFDPRPTEVSVDLFNSGHVPLAQRVLVDGPVVHGARLVARIAVCSASATSFRCKVDALAPRRDATLTISTSGSTHLAGTVEVRFGKRRATIPIDLSG